MSDVDEYGDAAEDIAAEDIAAEVIAAGDVVAEEIAADEARDTDDLLVLEEVDQSLPVWEPTGEPRVDAALDLLASMDPDDVHAHAATYDEIHQRLRATLTDLDSSA